MSANPLADDVWHDLSRYVLENKDQWRRAVVERTGLPFSRIRVLIRLARRPSTVKEVAQAATMDAPAATVAVNDLEERGLVVRQTDPSNRRCKVVSLTAKGREVLDVIDTTADPAPDGLADLPADDLAALQSIVAKLRKG